MKTVTLTRRPLDDDVYIGAIEDGYTDLQARILAGRLAGVVRDGLRRAVTPAISELTPPDALPDIEIASERLAAFVRDPGQKVVLCTDHDVDGQSAMVVLYTALVDHFGVAADRVGCVISHKRKEGFGVSEGLVDRLMDTYPAPALIVTADQGSQDEARFQVLKAAGYEIIVTDHHHIDEPPPSAIACVNPTRSDSVFPDPLISGCHVAWLLACATRRRLMAQGILPARAPSLGGLLDYVSASTVADSVSIARSHNNRAVINYGLALMNRADARPAWKAVRQVMGKEGPFTATDIAMGIGPRLNAVSRLGDAMPGFYFLRAQDEATALSYAAKADADNQTRKQIERAMVDAGRAIGAQQAQAHCNAVCIYFPDGNPGVHGIVASRMVEAFGRPSVCLSPKDGHPGVLTGSLRSIPGIDVHQALSALDALHPDRMISFGGHSGAAGVAIKESNLDAFRNAFDAAIGQQRDLSQAKPVVHHDGALGISPSVDVLTEISAVGPFGREFEAPAFEDTFVVAGARAVGDGTHLKLRLVDAQGQMHDGIWFRAQKPYEAPAVGEGETISAIYSLSLNHFRGNARLDIKVQYAATI